MPAFGDISLVKFEDATFVFPLTPATPVGGWSVEFLLTRRRGEGASGLVVKSCASGYGAGQSGVSVTDSGLGRFSVAWRGADGSGLDPGNYAFSLRRTDSGFSKELTQGTLVLGDSNAF